MTNNSLDSYTAVKVEIAFDGSGFAAADTTRTWTDVSAYVELDQGIDISVGRQDEFATADPNDLSLTLNNRDGRFTPGLASSPYYPNVVLYAAIRITATPVGGSAKVIFRGYIDEWPVSWRDVDLDADAKITAHSRMARLGVSNPLPSDFATANSGAAAYYPLSESASATQALDQSGQFRPAARRSSSISPLFGSESITPFDAATAAIFSGGVGASALTASPIPVSVNPIGSSTVAASAVIETSMASGSADILLVTYTDGTPIAKLSIISGVLQAFVGFLGMNLSYTASATPAVNDGVPHVVGFDFTANNGTGAYVTHVYVDGTMVASGSYSPLAPFQAWASSASLTIGSQAFAGYMAKAAIWDTVPNWSSLFSAITGYAGETAGARFTRYAQEALVPAAEIGASGCTTLMQGVDSTSAAIVDALRNVETTEAGMMWDRPDGVLELQPRSRRYAAASKFSLDMAKGHIDTYEPTLDSTTLLNQVTVTNGDNTVTQTVTDATSIALYGVESQSITTYASDPDEPLQRASWLVSSYKDPKPRVATLSVDLLLATADGLTLATLLSASVGDLITVINQPAQAMSSTSKYFIEGYQDTIDETGWTRVYNVSDATMWLNTFILDDPVRGVLDAGYRLAY